MNSFFKIVASPLMTLEAPLTFGSLSVMALARTLYQDHQTTLFVHGSSVESLLNDSSKYPLADLDLVAWSTPETCLQPIQTINTFFGKHLIPLINSNTRSVFAYHLKDSSLAGTQTKFSMTLYIQPPPTEIFDDIVHSSMLRLTPDIQLVYKYPDTKLTQTCKKENLLFSPYRSVINKHFFRTAMREAKGWNALYNPELDLRIYHNLYISINDPFLFKKEFIQAFDEHFNSQDTDSFNRMLFFSLSRIARHAGIPYAEQFFETIKDIFKESKKPSYIHFSSFITHIQTNNLIPDWNVFLQNSYSQTNAVSIFQLANLVENSESALGKQDIYHDFSQAICKHLHLPFPIPYALNQPTTSYVLDAFEHATTPPTDFLSNIIHPILSSMSSEKRSEILTKWMRLKKIHLNYAESFLSTTPDLLPSYLNYLSTLMARQNRPSFYIKRKFEQYSLISLPPVPQALQTIPHTTQSELGLTDTASISSRSDSPQAHLPDPTFELDRPTAEYFKQKKMILFSESLSFMEYAALESEGWNIHNLTVDSQIYEQGLPYKTDPEKFFKDLFETCSAYFPSSEPALQKTLFFAFSRLFRYSPPEEIALVWRHIQVQYKFLASHSPETFAQHLKTTHLVEKPMPFLKQTPQPIPSAKLLIHAITTLSSETDTHHLQLQLNMVLEKALTTHDPDQADTLLSLLDSAQKLNLKLSPKTHTLALKFLKELDRLHDSDKTTVTRVWAHLIYHAESHPSLNLNIHSLFKRFCLDPNFDPTMGPALIHYTITNQAPVSTTYLLSAISLLSDPSPYHTYITSLVTNEHVILSQPLESFLKISKQLLGAKNSMFQSILKPLLCRTDLNLTQHTLILDQWLPIQSNMDTIHLLESVDLLLQIRPNFQIPRKFHQPLLDGLKQAPTSTPFPKSLDLISNLLLKDSAQLFADLLPVFALSSTPIPSTLNTLVTSKDIFSEAISIDSFIGFCDQSLIPALTGDSQGFVTKFLCSALEYYSKQVSPNDFLALTQYILSLSDAHVALKAELLGLSLKLIPTSLLEHKPNIEAGYLALPFSKLSPSHRLNYLRIHPNIEAFIQINAEDCKQWGPSTFKDLLDHFIHTHINHPDFGDALSHYCSLYERGYGQFSAPSLRRVLEQFSPNLDLLSSFFKHITRKDFLHQYDSIIFDFLKQNPNFISLFSTSTSPDFLQSIFIKASRFLTSNPENTDWDLLLETALEHQISPKPIALFLSNLLKSHSKPKLRFATHPHLLSELASQKEKEIEKQREHEKQLVTEATRTLQHLFSQADRAWQDYLASTIPGHTFPFTEINIILNTFKSLAMTTQKSIIKKHFLFNSGKEYIYALPFLTGNIDDILYFHTLLEISPKQTLFENPQLIAFCIDRNDSAFLKHLFELEVSPNSKLHLIHENQTLTIFDYALKRKSQDCVSVIFDHPKFNQVQLFDFIAHSALHGDLETLSFIPSIPSLKEPSQTAQETMLERLITRIRQHPERKIPVQSLPSFAYLVQIGLINPSGNVPNHKQHSTPLSALSLALVLESSNDLHYDPSLHGLSTFLMHHGASLHHPDLSNILLLIYVRFKCFNTSAHPILENLKEALQSHSDPINSNSLKLLFSESEFQVEQHALTLVTEIDRFFGSSIKATLDHCKLTALAVRHFPKYPSVAEFLHTRGYTFDAFAFNNIHLNCVAAKYATLPVFQKLEEFGMPLDTTLELPHPVQNFGVMMNQVNLAELLYLLNLSTKLIPGMKSRIPDMESKLQFLTEKGLTIRPLVNEKSAELSALFLPLNLNL